MALAGESEGRYLLLINFSPLDDLSEATAHIRELKVCACLWARVLVVRVIFKVDSFVVHQILLIIDIVCHCYCT